MIELKTLKQLFQRYRRPGNLFFASLFLVASLFFLSQLSAQTQWREGTKFAAQPALWPAIAVFGMCFFAALNWISALVSPRIPGRWQEVGYWARSLEYVIWFMAYVSIVPYLGYLPASIIFALMMALRAGYRDFKMLSLSVMVAIATVLLFKTFLQVKVPVGHVYEVLPQVLRQFMMTNF